MCAPHQGHQQTQPWLPGPEELLVPVHVLPSQVHSSYIHFKVQFKTFENLPPSYSSLMSLDEVKFLFPFHKRVIPAFLSRLILFYKLLASRSYCRVTLLCDQNINQRELPVCVLIYTIQSVSPFPHFFTLC